MPLRLNRKQLVELIEYTEAQGNDATTLRRELEALGPEEKPVPQTRKDSRFKDEEETTEERLVRRVGDLFPNGIPYQEILDYDYRFNKNELIDQCRKADLGLSGDKKELAAKLIAHKRGVDNEPSLEEDIVEDKIDLNKQREWAGKPGEVTIPEVYLKDLRYEIVVFARKERGGSDFTFQCREYSQQADGEWRFSGVVIDTSKKVNDKIDEVRVTYHPEMSLINIGFMVVPVAEDVEIS